MHPLLHPAILAAIATLLPQQPPPAQTSTPKVVEHVVVTATIAPQPADGVSRDVTTVTRVDLEQLGVSSVIEALRLVPGLDPRARGPQDVQTDFSIRGATFGQGLILVDGMRINDSQSGHHNGDIPIAVDSLDRIEVVAGGGSAVHGADALGGAINFITRTDEHAVGTFMTGQHQTFLGQGSISGHGLPTGWLLTGWGGSSDGFMFDRDFSEGGAALRGTLRPGLTVDLRHQRKAFGANGFYGNSPSKEWTDQTVAAIAYQRATASWVTQVRGLFRDHGDHFRWDIARPGFAENTHRTNAGEIVATAERVLTGGRRLTIGAATGADRVTSSNLGNHDYTRGSGFAEVQLPAGAKTVVQGGLRFDGYSNFGSSWNPSIGVSSRVSSTVRVRASAAHAFRVPTFTELYYHDPGNLGTPTLTAERGWSFDGGADISHRGWTFSVTPFRRMDDDVIDWVKVLPTDLWRSTNVRDVTTTGIETSASRRWQQVLFQMSFTGIKVDAPDLSTLATPLLSKYVKEYARHSTAGSVAFPIGGGIRFAMNVDHRHRLDGQNYALVAARVDRAFKHAGVFLSGSNLLNENYHEIAGVAMPGRWMMVGVSFGDR